MRGSIPTRSNSWPRRSHGAPGRLDGGAAQRNGSAGSRAATVAGRADAGPGCSRFERPNFGSSSHRCERRTSPGNLRRAATSFIGRRSEAVKVEAALRAHQLVTLTGGRRRQDPSRNRSAARLGDRFPNGTRGAKRSLRDGNAEVIQRPSPGSRGVHERRHAVRRAAASRLWGVAAHVEATRTSAREAWRWPVS